MKMYDEMSIVNIEGEIYFVENEISFNEGLDWESELSPITYAQRLIQANFGEDEDLVYKHIEVRNFRNTLRGMIMDIVTIDGEETNYRWREVL